MDQVSPFPWPDEPGRRAPKRWSLTSRILAVNLFALLMLAGGIIYLDSYRERLIEQRREQVQTTTMLIADAVGEAFDGGATQDVAMLAARLGRTADARLRIYDPSGRLIVDSWSLGPPTFRLRNPAAEPWRKHVARFLDRLVEFLGSAAPMPDYVEPSPDRRQAWPEAEMARQGRVVDALRRAPDRTIIISVAAPIAGSGGSVVHAAVDTRDITRVVRSERLTSFLIFLGVLALSVLLSWFLARTIVLPLQRLSLAAQRVRLGRAREVRIPRFTKRRDEIGQLARALSDMTQALRNRMDAIESFAADVAHEIKNPLASLRSAAESISIVKDEALKAQLLDVILDDVGRIDRLITDIAQASRLDAELSRISFATVDLGQMTETLVHLIERVGLPRGIQIAYARPEPGTALVQGDEGRLGQGVRNLVDNAISFSPDDGVVRLTITHGDNEVLLRVEDDGPGVPLENMQDIFKRFYSVRPSDENFGKHSGLGLAIARTIVEAHDGTIVVENRMHDGEIVGARFTVRLPAAQGMDMV